MLAASQLNVTKGRKRCEPEPPADALTAELATALLCNLGCGSCRQRKKGCKRCRPKAARALQEAGQEELLLLIGNCDEGATGALPALS
jgi:hypothetical protein